MLESKNEFIASQITNEQMKLRKAEFEEILRKRREEQEEFERQKELLRAQRSSARYQSDQGESGEEYEDGNLVNDELDEDDYDESSENDDQSLLGSPGFAKAFNPNDQQMLFEYIKKSME